MTSSSKRRFALVLCLTTGFSACSLFKTGDDEAVAGRGPAAADPYAGSLSGAIRLSLEWFGGCAIVPSSGEPVARGTTRIPYPNECPDVREYAPDQALVPPSGTLQLRTDTNYFLNSLTLMDSVVDRHTNGADLLAPSKWIRNDSRFKDLDWSNLAVTSDRYVPLDSASWKREVLFGNAAWMLDGSDQFLVELLNADGDVTSSATYTRQSFLAENSTAGHSQVSWLATYVEPPAAPGDSRTVATPQTTFRTSVRIDMQAATTISNQVRTPSGAGAGAIRVTWSKLPGAPFYFPVQYVTLQDSPSACLAADGGALRACDFGLDPQVKLSRPANGSFYVPGERFELRIALKDSLGNGLHPSGELPSFDETQGVEANGIFYYSSKVESTLELDSEPVYQVAGPLQDLNPQVGLWANEPQTGAAPYFRLDKGTPVAYVPQVSSGGAVTGLRSVRWPSSQVVTLPPDVKPGTYVVLLKAHRYFLGERITRTAVAYFQVGQKEVTTYPTRVGNCQICHRGVLSLENVRHGLGVDHVESCKTCHNNNLGPEVHQIHSRSAKFLLKKNDCTVCHLTRAGATRPSFDLCSSCHPSIHGTEYFASQFSLVTPPNRYGNCSETCHGGMAAPINHILPKN